MKRDFLRDRGEKAGKRKGNPLLDGPTRRLRKALSGIFIDQRDDVLSRLSGLLRKKIGKDSSSISVDWDKKVVDALRPLLLAIYKIGGDHALDSVRKFPKIGKGMKYYPSMMVEKSLPVHFIIRKGGAGSGNFNHAGRPGERGGSGDGGEISDSIKESEAYMANQPPMKLIKVRDDDGDFETTAIPGTHLFKTNNGDIIACSKEDGQWDLESIYNGRVSTIEEGKINDPDALERLAKELEDKRWEMVEAGDDRIGDPGILFEKYPSIYNRIYDDGDLPSISDQEAFLDYVDSLPKQKGFSSPSLKADINIELTDWLLDPKVVKAIEEEMYSFAHQINQTSADKLRETMLRGIEQGDNISTISNGVSAICDEWAEGSRAEMIARTETIRAFNAGHMEAWRSTGVINRKVWVAAADACPFCLDLNGTIIDLNQNFFDFGTEQEAEWNGHLLSMTHDYSDVDGPPLHPNCRCSVVGELADDWEDIAGLEEEKSLKGGPGSGNFNHEGRPGEVGGSGDGDGESNSGMSEESKRILDIFGGDPHGPVMITSKYPYGLKSVEIKAIEKTMAFIKEKGFIIPPSYPVIFGRFRIARGADAIHQSHNGAASTIGLSTKSYNREEVIVHEYGHAIDSFLGKDGADLSIEIASRTQPGTSDIRAREAFAECFSDIIYERGDESPFKSEVIKSLVVLKKEEKGLKGGPGSGNFGHGGRPGEVGGSSSDGAGDLPSTISTPFDAEMEKKEFVLPKRAQKEAKLVWVDVQKFDEGFKKDLGYIGPQGEGGIHDRYPRFGEFFNANTSIEVPEVVISKGEWSERGTAQFINGRHRYAWMRDQGASKIPVALYQMKDVMSLSDAKKEGFVVDKGFQSQKKENEKKEIEQ